MDRERQTEIGREAETVHCFIGFPQYAFGLMFDDKHRG